MTPTSDERREVAERVRKAHGIMAFVDALGIDVDSDWCWTDVSRRVADLIDPTCNVKDDNRWSSDFDYVCRDCGEHFSTCDEPRYCPGCGARVVNE